MRAAQARVVDALGTWCPVPIHLIDRAAHRAAPGEVIELLADDPLIEVDLPAWCHSSGNDLLELRREEGGDYVGRVAVSHRLTGTAAHGSIMIGRSTGGAMTEKLYAIIHEADGDTIWRWQTGRKAKFVEYGGHHRARELAEDSGAVLALWGTQYGQRGVPGDATPDAVMACVQDAIDRAAEHPG